MDSAHGPFHVTWSALTSLNCARTECVGLAKLSFGWRSCVRSLGKEVVEGRFAARFDLDPRLHDTRAMRGRGHDGFVLALVGRRDVRIGLAGETQIRPVAIADVACGSKICAAIGVTTVMTLRP